MRCGAKVSVPSKHLGQSPGCLIDKTEKPLKKGTFRFEILRNGKVLRRIEQKMAEQDAVWLAQAFRKAYSKLLSDVVVIATSEGVSRIVVRS